jgi:shikimate kinase
LGNPRAQWQALNDKRRPIYENLASVCIKVDDMSVKQIVEEIKKKLA